MIKPPAPPPTSHDRVTLLATFVRIVEAGSLSAAAAQLGTTQPTVSRRLSALERALGVPLLQRSTHAMKLTEDGERCFEHARGLLASLEAFEDDLRSARDEPSGNLRVVVPHAFGQTQLVGPLAAYLARYPAVNAEWILSDQTPNFIADGVDIAIHVGAVTDPSLIALRMGAVPRIVVAAPRLFGDRAPPAHPSALAAAPWLALSTFYRTLVTLSCATTGERIELPIRPRMSTDRLYALRSAAVLGVGLAVVSAWLVEEDLASGRLIRVAPTWAADPLPITLLYPSARFYSVRLRRFVEAMRTSLVEGGAEWAGQPTRSQR